ncbi:L-2-amino-thiazoline-4-carboxylic acid hydrolase [Chloroflexota bacterium]
MTEPKAVSYYESRKPKLLKDFDKTANLVRDFVVVGHGESFANNLHLEARREYEAIIPQIPYVEGPRGGMLNSFLRITAQEVAVYKAMKKLGKTAPEAWEICHKALRLRMEKFPRIRRWIMSLVMNSGVLMKRMRKLAQEGKHFGFGDFEIMYVMGNGEDFDFGVDYVACGNYKLVQDLGAEEFAPYVCMSDIALSDAMNWGLIRTETLADGCQRCDFRFKKGGKTRISSKTPEVQATIETIAAEEAAS